PRPAEPAPASPAPPARALPPLPTAAAIPPPPAAEQPARLTVRAAANIRAQPNNKATIIRTAPQGEVLREFSRSYDDWVEVGDTRPQGWMFGKYLVPVKP
ncbi:SH3 domain-containing protein, partial [Dankookia rubra]